MAKWSELSERDRDALIAEKVMGWQYIPYTAYIGGPPEAAEKLAIERGWYTWQNESGVDEQLLPDYTSDMNAAMQVAEHFEFVLLHRGNGHWQVYRNAGDFDYDYSQGNFYAEGPLPAAICHAACLALGLVEA